LRPSTAPEEWWSGHVLDLSLVGLRLLLGRRLAPGSRLAIEVRARPGAASRRLVADVVHAHFCRHGGWELGCELVTKLSQEELRTLLA
jgi:hypothetical protein